MDAIYTMDDKYMRVVLAVLAQAVQVLNENGFQVKGGITTDGLVYIVRADQLMVLNATVIPAHTETTTVQTAPATTATTTESAVTTDATTDAPTQTTPSYANVVKQPASPHKSKIDAQPAQDAELCASVQTTPVRKSRGRGGRKGAPEKAASPTREPLPPGYVYGSHGERKDEPMPICDNGPECDGRCRHAKDDSTVIHMDGRNSHKMVHGNMAGSVPRTQNFCDNGSTHMCEDANCRQNHIRDALYNPEKRNRKRRDAEPVNDRQLLKNTN